MNHKQRGSGFVLIFLAIIVAMAFAIAYLGKAAPGAEVSKTWAVYCFTVDLACVAGTLGSIGYAVTGSFTGIAINGLNQYSLSRLQMGCWTILIIAAVLSFAQLNLLGSYDPLVSPPLKIGIPSDLLQAMGIAAFTTGAVPAILALKKGQGGPSVPEGNAAIHRFSVTTGTPTDEVTTTGQVMGRKDRDQAVWIDMLLGDEIANAGVIDISKVQQFLITLLLLGVYIWAIIGMLGSATAPLTKLPDIDNDFIKLLALSHAGYLGYKIAPKAPSEADTTSTDAKPAPKAATAAATAADNRVQLRLTIADAPSLTDLSLTVDGVALQIAQNGEAELALSRNVDHEIVVDAKRNARQVSGAFHVVPSDDDHDMVRDLSLN